MRKLAYILTCLALFFLFFSRSSRAEEKRTEPNQLFYAANYRYENRDYEKAIEGYVAIIDRGLESGNLYYNVGNAFLKLKKLGYAILCYEKAGRLIPQDGDLKSNLAYARSLAGVTSFEEGRRNFVLDAVKAPFRDFNLNAIAVSGAILYLFAALILSVFLLKPYLAKKLAFPSFIVIALFLLNLAALYVRYYDEEISKHAVVIQKEAECKYEPIDTSTTYYKLQEGDEAAVLKTRNGWRQVERPDGKRAWVKKEAVEPI